MKLTDVQQSYLATAVGRFALMAVEKNGHQCPDVPKDYAQALWPRLPWTTTVGYGEAKDLFRNMPDKYWTKVANDPKNPSQIPPPGSIIVWDGWPANEYGHIALVEASSNQGVRVIQQDGTYRWKPMHRAYFPYGWHKIIGWLIPKVNMKGDENMLVDNDALEVLFRLLLGRSPDASAKRTYIGKRFELAYKSILASEEYKNKQIAAKSGTLNVKNHLPQALRSVYKAPVGEYRQITEPIYKKVTEKK